MQNMPEAKLYSRLLKQSVNTFPLLMTAMSKTYTMQQNRPGLISAVQAALNHV